MKLGKKQILGTVIFIFVMGTFLGASGYFLQHKLNKAEDLLYAFRFQDIGIIYEVNVYNNIIKVKASNECSLDSCEENEYSKQYKEEDQAKLINFLENNFEFKNDQIADINYDTLNNYQQEVLATFSTYQSDELYFQYAIEDYQYKMEIELGKDATFVLYLKNDLTMVGKKIEYNKDYEITNISSYNYNFKDQNKQIIKDYIKNNLEKNETVLKIYAYDLENKPIIDAIINNDEKYLKNYKTNRTKVYTISYKGIDCPSPVLVLYDDGTYEYYHTYSKVLVTPKTGEYKTSLFSAILAGKITSQNSAYTINDSKDNSLTFNAELLQDFLNNYDLPLAKCLESED